MNNISHWYKAIKTYETIIASLVALGVVPILFFVFLVPNLTIVNKLGTQKEYLQNHILLLKKKTETLSSLDQKYYKDVFTKIHNALPSSKDYASLFDTLTVIQSKTGVTITNADFQLGILSTTSAELKKLPGEEAYVVPVTIEMAGFTSQVIRSIDALQDLTGRFITIEDMSLSVDIDDRMKIKVSGYGYFYPETKTIGSVDSPLPPVTEQIASTFDEISKKIQLLPSYEQETSIPVGKKDIFR